MIPKIFRFIPLLFLFYSCQKPSPTQIAESVESIIENAEMDSSFFKAYSENGFKPLWVKSKGLKNSGMDYLEALDDIKFDGLDKEDYLSEEEALLMEKIQESKDPALHARLDIALSHSFLKLASDLNIGKINPSTLNIEWKMERKVPVLNKEELLMSISSGKSVKKILNSCRPDNFLYSELSSILKRLLTKPIKETASIETPKEKIEIGQTHVSIPAISEKLWLLGDLKEQSQSEGTEYEEDLQEAVKQFQKRNGLFTDGIIGPDFITAINYSYSDLVTKTEVNLERLRWLPDFIPSEKNKVIVNIPDYHLYYVSNDDTVFTSRTIVGKDYRQTPVFKAEMTHLVFSPTWTLPETILWEDVIPAIQKDSDYLRKNNMKVLDFQENEIDIEEVDWEELKEIEDFTYLIRQAPGEQNPLGRVKFMFPNEFSIYIHDSPAKALFSREERTFSSGCIRVEQPEKLASILLDGVAGWDEAKISEAMNLDEEKKINLDKTLEVWILYLTVWDEDGEMQVREDIYEMDSQLAEAMALPLLGER
ncbi:MAG: L,D-transpeptidase family protein [Cyclobacteriaceae bacterium]